MNFQLVTVPKPPAGVTAENVTINFEEIKVTYSRADKDHDKWIPILSW